MNTPISLDFSLYKIALSASPAIHPLQLSPSTLDSIVTAIIDLLIEQNIAAGFLIKMPTSQSWFTQLQKYQEHGNFLDIYILHSEQFEKTGINASAEAASTYSPLRANTDPSLLKSTPTSRHEARTLHIFQNNDANVLETPAIKTSFKTIQYSLPVEATLMRESFFLVFSEQFCLTLVTHQPRSIRLPETSSQNTKASDFVNKTGRTPSITHERQPFLLSVCSTHQQTLEKVLAGLQQSVKELSPFSTVLNNWLKLSLPGTQASPTSVNLIDQLWLKQISQQEQVFHALNNARASAADATTLLLQNEELLEAMQLKDEFLSNVGQELRTPLTNMKTALTLLNSPNLKPAQRERYMQVLHTECDRQSSLINGLLEMVRLDHVVDQQAMQPLLLIDIVPGVVSTYQPLATEKGVMLAYTIPDHLPPVACLRPWLKQIVINLLNNGIQYTPKNGKVWVKAKQQGDYVQIEFRDTGIGIPTHELHKIFERFYRVRQTTEDDPGGAGLGLTMVQQLLLRCGGSITVKSQVGEGSVFHVLLPVYQDN